MLLSIISEVKDDDLKEWNKEAESYNISKTEPYAYTSEVLSEISNKLGAKFTLKTFISYIS